MLQAPITDGVPIGPTQQGSLWSASIPGMTKALPSVPPGAPGNAYLVEAYLDQELGGDKWTGNPPGA